MKELERSGNTRMWTTTGQNVSKPMSFNTIFFDVLWNEANLGKIWVECLYTETCSLICTDFFNDSFHRGFNFELLLKPLKYKSVHQDKETKPALSFSQKTEKFQPHSARIELYVTFLLILSLLVQCRVNIK